MSAKLQVEVRAELDDIPAILDDVSVEIEAGEMKGELTFRSGSALWEVLDA